MRKHLTVYTRKKIVWKREEERDIERVRNFAYFAYIAYVDGGQNAQKTLEDALADGDVAAAVQILRAVGMYGSVGAPEGETDPKLLMRQQAEEWAETELQRRGVGKHPDAVVELADKTGYWTQKRELTKQRVAELEDEFRTDHADRGGPNIS